MKSKHSRLRPRVGQPRRRVDARPPAAKPAPPAPAAGDRRRRQLALPHLVGDHVGVVRVEVAVPAHLRRATSARTRRCSQTRGRSGRSTTPGTAPTQPPGRITFDPDADDEVPATAAASRSPTAASTPRPRCQRRSAPADARRPRGPSGAGAGCGGARESVVRPTPPDWKFIMARRKSTCTTAADRSIRDAARVEPQNCAAWLQLESRCC